MNIGIGRRSQEDISNMPATILQRRIKDNPKNIFLFGAGASYGSDSPALVKSRELPPLGKNLFESLSKEKSLASWSELPKEFVTQFSSKRFEEAMDFLDSNDTWAIDSIKRDLDLCRYFARFNSRESNQYWKLAKAIAAKLKTYSWSGAIVTLNYERLIEESLMRNRVFTVVRGVTYYDNPIPPLEINQLVEVCYPHGACQFYLGQNWFTGDGNVNFGPEARVLQTAGVNHILNQRNIPLACDQKQIPMICRYQSSKRASVKNYFLDSQRARCAELFMNATMITICGVLCTHEYDHHLWEPLAKSGAFINYVEPFAESQELFKKWAEAVGKKRGANFRIIPSMFKEAMPIIREINGL